MMIHKLHENWKMCIAGTEDYIPATVPGSVYHDLLANGRMEDPYYRDNEMKALKVMEDDFEYVSVFDVEAGLLKCDAVLLHFDGIDTVADIFFNGTRIASVENMHRTWEFPVKEILRETGNELKVVLHSPTKYIREAYAREHIPGSGDAFPILRLFPRHKQKQQDSHNCRYACSRPNQYSTFPQNGSFLFLPLRRSVCGGSALWTKCGALPKLFSTLFANHIFPPSALPIYLHDLHEPLPVFCAAIIFL